MSFEKIIISAIKEIVDAEYDKKSFLEKVTIVACIQNYSGDCHFVFIIFYGYYTVCGYYA